MAKITPTETAIPTSTIKFVSPTPTITPTPPLLPTYYQVPIWLADPNYAVFAMVTEVSDNSNEITFFNADTHEKMIISVPNSNISRFFWTPDGNNFGFVETDFLTIHLIDLKTGKVIDYHLPEQSLHCLDKYRKVKWSTIKNMQVYSSSPLDSAFFCPKPSIHVSKEEKEGKAITIIEDMETGRKIETPDSNGNLSIIYFVVSPLQNQLAILQGPAPLDLLQPMGTQIVIYSLENGEIINAFKGQFCSIDWSPDEKKLLVTKSDSDGCYSSALPAILLPKTGQAESISAIENTHKDINQISLFNWSSDGNSIYYEFSNLNGSDICRYDLPNGEVFCLTKNFGELEDKNIEHYKISPDERFIVFQYGYSCFGCDFWGEPSSALIRIDGSDMMIIGKEVFISDPSSTYPYSTLTWRPLPNP